MFIDTHCHISKDDYDDIEKVIENAKENNVGMLLVCGCDKKGIKEAIEIAESHDNIYLEIGYHPSETSTTTDEDLEELKTLAKNPKVVAIGEIGLDYHWEKDNKEDQKKLFRKQIKLAKELNLPIVIHTRDAFQDTYDILKEENHYGDIHCFSGNKENAKMYVSLGYYLGIGGVLTFKNTNLTETIKEIPIEKILLETDCPYLTPEPYRKEKNEPMYVPIIAKKISEILGKDLKEVESTIYDNTIKLFKLK